jgi:hypothetical protein
MNSFFNVTSADYKEVDRFARQWTGAQGFYAQGAPPRSMVQAARAGLLEWDMKQWNRTVQRFAALTPTKVASVVRQMAMWLLARCRARTPVGDPARWSPYWQDKVPQGYVGGTARAGWHLEGEDYTGDQPRAWVVNAVPYIVMLEFGWSKIAPQGMLRISLRELKREMNRRLKVAVTPPRSSE